MTARGWISRDEV
jgi:hypothetical protein